MRFSAKLAYYGPTGSTTTSTNFRKPRSPGVQENRMGVVDGSLKSRGLHLVSNDGSHLTFSTIYEAHASKER